MSAGDATQYSRAWASLRFRLRAAAIGTTFAVATLAAYGPLDLPVWTAFAACLLFGASWQIVGNFRCPGCAGRFFHHPSPFRAPLGFLSRRCVHCGTRSGQTDPRLGPV
ncbi:MAG: hypothetical protein FJ104_06940 [Deltaproteobacteria bacterium]|nr:hypothetical protein [Deltaproteobacteria bacterium]